jgi:tetratricopeptide (TPR) repeat protein
MAELAERHPDDTEIAVLYGESLMDLSPWSYWTAAGEPRPGTQEALAGFERVRAANPDHPGACHFFIHAVEAVDPDRAVACAERLASLMPGAGHLVHMPGHIYIRVGRYADAITANEHAVHADETYIQDQRPGMGVYTAGYYPHNYDFLAFAASMAGRRAQALEAARQVKTLVPADMMGAPGMAFLDHWWARPLQIQIRFGLWNEILASDAPPAGRAHSQAMWHYARGRALAATREPAAAREELAALREIAGDPSLEGVGMEFNLSTDLLALATRVLEGAIAEAEGDTGRALDLLREAAALEDALTYGEPPEWSVPVRHDLGAALLRAGEAEEAERVYREDLERFRANGWALSGLAHALRAQGRDADAEQVEAQLRDAWASADVPVPEPVG